MKKHLPKQKSSGYTIIEIIISLFILIILFAVAQANYRQFILAKSLDAVKSRIISDAKLAQEYALAGKTTATCTGLNGYLFSISVTNNNYTISADCATDVLIKTVRISDVAKGISFSGSNASILFKVLGGGVNITVGGIGYLPNVALTITQQTTNNVRIITVTSGGEVR